MNFFDAIKKNNIQFVKTIIHQDPFVVNLQDSLDWTPLHFACRYSHTEIAQLLINVGADVHVQDNSGRTPLHLTCDFGCKEIAQLLINVGADVNAKDKAGRTPLHLACIFSSRHGHAEIAQLLIDAGADVHAQDNNDWTLLHYACYCGRKEIVRLVMICGVDWLMVNKECRTPVDLAIEQDDMLVVLENNIDQLPDAERKKIQAWRFRLELLKTS